MPHRAVADEHRARLELRGEIGRRDHAGLATRARHEDLSPARVDHRGGTGAPRKQRVERAHPANRHAEPEREPTCRRDADPQAGERPGAGADANRVELPAEHARLLEQLLDEQKHALSCSRFTRTALGEHDPVSPDAARDERGRGVESEHIRHAVRLRDALDLARPIVERRDSHDNRWRRQLAAANIRPLDEGRTHIGKVGLEVTPGLVVERARA